MRVLELATGVAGPYAGRLFAMLGATVVKAEPDGGDLARRLQVDDQLLAPGAISPLFVHLNAGKRLVSRARVDEALDAAVAWADVVLAQRADVDRLRALARGRLVIATTEDRHPSDELLVQAMSGVMSSTGEEGREPLRFPGWQSQYLAGGYLAAASLGVLGEQPDGGVTHIDVPWAGAMLSGVESGTCAHIQPASRRDGDGMADAERQAGFQVGAFPSGAFRCKDGYVVPGTVRPIDWDIQCTKVYDRPELLEDERFQYRTRWPNREALRAELQPWYDAHTKREIFDAALATGWAAAMVMTAGDAIDDEHLRVRGFLSKVTGAVDAVVPGRPWRAKGIADAAPVRLAAQGEDDAALPGLFEPDVAGFRSPQPRKLKVIELTWAWAGPFAGRLLGALGADVVRIETGRYPDGWRTKLKWKHAAVAIPDGADPDDATWDAAALFNTLARNKRGVSIDLTTEDGRQAFLDLLAHADVLIANMTYSVLSDRGIEDDVRAAVKDRGLVFANMPALGATGPFRDMPGYGMLMEGMGGFSARFGYVDEGARASATYYPDPVAGLHGAIAVLAALVQRESTGEGSMIDLSQQETTWLQLGEGIALRSMEGREPERLGNREPGVAESGLRRDGDSWVAFVGDRSERVMAHRDLYPDALRYRGLLETHVHPVTGERDYLAIPVFVDGAPLAGTRAAPVFDQHTDEVLREWAGYDDATLAARRASGAIGTVPGSARR